MFGSDRLAILRSVLGSPLRYTELAKVLRISEGELSRNLRRLTDAGLLDRRPDGAFTPTPLARSALAFSPGLEFLAAHDDFARTHALDELPRASLLRIDDLAAAELLDDPFALFRGLSTVFRTVTRSFVGQWVIGQQSVQTPEETEIQRELAGRILEHKPEVRVVAIEDEIPLYGFAAPIAHLMHVRTLPAAPTSGAISDEAAVVQFNGTDGRIDANYGFFGRDPRFVGWCRDLFEHYWSRAQPFAPGRLGKTPAADAAPRASAAPARRRRAAQPPRRL